jgi:hypothetical protein
MKGMHFQKRSQAFGPGFHTESVENASTESIILNGASDITPKSQDTSAETEVCLVALYQRPF